MSAPVRLGARQVVALRRIDAQVVELPPDFVEPGLVVLDRVVRDRLPAPVLDGPAPEHLVALRRVPLGRLRVWHTWAGLRTFAPDRVPVVGPDPVEPTFIWLAGQGGYGIKVAPALARVAAACGLGETLPHDLASLSPGRFRAVAER